MFRNVFDFKYVIDEESINPYQIFYISIINLDIKYIFVIAISIDTDYTDNFYV